MDRWAMNFDIYPQCKPISMLLQIYQKDLDKKGFCFLCSKHINSKENRKQKFPKVFYGKKYYICTIHYVCHLW